MATDAQIKSIGHPCQQTETIELDLSDEDAVKLLDRLAEYEIRVHPSKSNRRSVRVFTIGTALVKDGLRVFRVRMRNISRHGCAFLTNQSVNVNSQIVLELPTVIDGTDTHLATVVRCTQMGGFTHEIGVEFIGVF